MTPKTMRGFALVYALLFLVVIGSGLGAYATYRLPSKASARVEHWRGKEVAAIRRQLGDQNLTWLADKYIADRAQLQGFAVVKIVVLSVTVKGDAATVVARVTVTDGVQQATQTLRVALQRGVWNPQSLSGA